MRSVMKNTFRELPQANIRRSSFNRSHGWKGTFDAGYLIPVYADEVLPGDTINLKMTAFMRLATPLHPFMDNMKLTSFFVFCPNRLIQDNWPKLMGEQKNPGDSTDFMTPIVVSPLGGFLNQSFYDYIGVPTQVAGLEVCNLWGRCYNLFYNEFVRDENLQNSIVVDTDDGPDDPADYVIRRRGKRPDYFTSCLPWPQKGPAVDLPLGTSAPIRWDEIGASGLADDKFVVIARGATVDAANYSGTWQNVGATLPNNTNYNMYADLSDAAGATINSWRLALQTQGIYETDARGGTRYIEMLRAHFGVINPDFRLQRPEYLGGDSTYLTVTPIAQTSSTDGEPTPQGNLAAMGTVSVRGGNHGFVKSFTEHGVLLGMVQVSADLTYQQGLHRMFSRRTRFDFYFPGFAHLGEMAVLNKEIYAQGTSADDDVFGYQEHWAEYRYKPSIITGKFRSNDAQTLDTWHLSQEFSSLPLLNSTFISDNPPVDRVLAVTDEPEFIADIFFDLIHVRPLPLYSVPGTLARI